MSRPGASIGGTLDPPSNIITDAAEDSINITYDMPTGANMVTITIGTSTGDVDSQVTDDDGDYTFTSLDAETTYYFTLQAFSTTTGNSSPPASEVNDTTGAAEEPSGDSISDTFTASNGTTLLGRTPDTADVGTTYSGSGSPQIQDNAAAFTSSSDYVFINYGHDTHEVVIDINSGGANNHFGIEVARDNAPASTKTCYEVLWRVSEDNIRVHSVDAGSPTILSNSTGTDLFGSALDNSASYTIKIKVSDVNVTTSLLEVSVDDGGGYQEVYNSEETKLGNTHIGLKHLTFVDGSLRADNLGVTLPEVASINLLAAVVHLRHHMHAL